MGLHVCEGVGWDGICMRGWGGMGRDEEEGMGFIILYFINLYQIMCVLYIN